MKNQHQFISPVHNGILADFARKGIRTALQSLEGKKIKVVIEEYKRKRSKNQNAFYFGCIVPAIRMWLLDQGINFDAEETHEFVVRHIWKHTEVINLDKQPYERRLSSTKLNTGEWEQYLDLTRHWASEKGLELPFPNEYLLAG